VTLNIAKSEDPDSVSEGEMIQILMLCEEAMSQPQFRSRPRDNNSEHCPYQHTAGREPLYCDPHPPPATTTTASPSCRITRPTRPLLPTRHTTTAGCSLVLACHVAAATHLVPRVRLSSVFSILPLMSPLAMLHNVEGHFGLLSFVFIFLFPRKWS
jgi:hypothetical protein